MANIEGKNFTDFRNINLRGDGYVGGAPSGALAGASGSPAIGGVIRLASAQTFGGLVGGTGAWDTTIAIQNFGGATVAANTTTDEVPYVSIANAGLNLGTGYIRLVPAGNASGNAGTLSVSTTYLDSDRAWQFPNISGSFGVTGTFSVDLPSVAASGYLTTVVTVTGIRTEDGVVVVPQSVGANTNMSARAPLVIWETLPGNGNLTITLINPWATATLARSSNVFGYSAVR